MKINVKYIVMSILLGLAGQGVFSFVKLGEFTTRDFPAQFVEYKGTICCLLSVLKEEVRYPNNERFDEFSLSLLKYVPNALEFYERSSKSEYKLKHTLCVKQGIDRIKVIDGKLYVSLHKPSWSGIKSYLESEEKSNFESYQTDDLPREEDRDFFRDIFLVGLKGCTIKNFVCFDDMFYLNPEEGPLKKIDLAAPRIVETPTLLGCNKLNYGLDKSSGLCNIFAYNKDLLIFGYQYLDDSKGRIKYFLKLCDPKSLRVKETYPIPEVFRADPQFDSVQVSSPKGTRAFLDGDSFLIIHHCNYGGTEIRVKLTDGQTPEWRPTIGSKEDYMDRAGGDRFSDMCNGIQYRHYMHDISPAFGKYPQFEKRLTFWVYDPNVRFGYCSSHLQGDVAVLENHLLLYDNKEHNRTKVDVYSLPPSLNNIVHKIRKRDEFLEPILRVCYSRAEGKSGDLMEIVFGDLIKNSLMKRNKFLESSLKESYFLSKDGDKKGVPSELLAALSEVDASKKKGALIFYNKPDEGPLGLFAQLPLEVLLCCFKDLDIVSFSRLGQTSKSMNKLLQGEIFLQFRDNDFQKLKKQFLGEKVRWSWLAMDSKNYLELVHELGVAIKKRDPVALWIGRELLAKQDGEKQIEK